MPVGSCVATFTTAITINALPTLTVSASSNSICNGSAAILTATGASTYTLLNTSSAFTTSISVSPLAATTYTISGTSSGGCIGTTTTTVTVNRLPYVTSTATSNTICSGNTLTLTATGTTGLLAYYKFDETSGNMANDATGNGNTGMYASFPTGTTSAAFSGSGNAITFSNSNGSYIDVSDNAMFNTMLNNLTLEAWIYQTDAESNTIIDRGNYNFLFMSRPNSQTGLGFYNNGNWTYSSGTIPLNQWVHVAVTYNSGTLSFYMNGALLSTHTSPALTFGSGGNINIGRQDPSSCRCNEFDGNIDELRIWNVTRTQSEIQASMTSGPAGNNVSFAWLPSAGLTATTGATITATPTVNTTYTLTGTDNNGCTKTSTQSIIVSDLPTVGVSVSPSATVCFGSNVTLSGTGASTYSWSGGINNGTAFTATNTGTSTYTVIGTNANGCKDTTTQSLVTLNGSNGIHTWRGSTNTGWNNTGNWCGGVPSSTVSVIIPLGLSNYPVILPADGNAVLNNLIIENAAQLTLNNNASLSVYGNWTNNNSNGDGFVADNGSTVTFAGSLPQSFSLAATETFYNLVINNTSSSGLTINGSDLAIVNNITFTDGLLNTGVGTSLLIEDNATATGSSQASFVNGTIKKIGDDAFLFPIGDSVYAPIEIVNDASFQNFNTNTEFTATYYKSAAPNNSDAYMSSGLQYVSSLEYWNLSRTFDLGNNAQCNVRLYFSDTAFSQIKSTALSDLIVAHFSSVYETQGGSTVLTGKGGNITSTIPFTSFSPITFGSSGGINPLPVELLRFKAWIAVDKKVKLSWDVASEINNDFYTVERSIDAINYQPILTVKGAGTSNSLLNYSVTDTSPLMGISYYRLKQTDFDGKNKTFKPISIELTEEETPKGKYTFYQNPLSLQDDLFLKVNSAKNKSIQLSFTDVSGKILCTQTVELLTGHNQIMVKDINCYLKSGTYTIVINDEEKAYKEKLIVK